MVAGDPKGYTLTESYGPTPPCVDNGIVEHCDWYGFVSNLFPALGASCLVDTREVLSNTSFEGVLLPDYLYYLDKYVYDPSTNASYCVYGCLYSNVSAPAPAPGAAQAPPPTSSPPPGFTPAPSSPSTPATTSAPAPSPDSDLDSPPSPPGLIAPPSPPASSKHPPPTLPNGTPTIFNLNGVGFLQPTGLLSFMISAALLIFNGLVAF